MATIRFVLIRGTGGQLDKLVGVELFRAETYCSSPRQIHLHTRLCDYISDISGYISARSCIGTQTAGKLFIISIVRSQLPDRSSLTSQDVMVLLQSFSSLLSRQSKYPSQTFSLGIHRLPAVSFWEPRSSGARHSWSVSCFCR